jgi:tetratricopeptide (TPR) repeat protein
MGLDGNAIHYAESALEGTPPEVWPDHYFYTVLQLFSVYVSIYSTKADECRKTLQTLSGKTQSSFRLAYYHHVLGDYFWGNEDHAQALAQYEAAQKLYEAISNTDDVARMHTKIAHIYLFQNRVDQCKDKIDLLSHLIQKLESDDIRAEFQMLKLSYHCQAGSDNKIVRGCLSICEQERRRVRQCRVSLNMDARLSRVSLMLGDYDRAKKYFNDYYLRVKEVCSNLPTPDYVTEYIRNPEFTELVSKIKEIKKRNPSHGSGG